MTPVIPKSLINYCEKHGITYEKESETIVEFKAPEGFIFSNESRYRILELGDDSGEPIRTMKVKEIKLHLWLSPDDTHDRS